MPISAVQLIQGLQQSLAMRHIDFEAVIASFGQVEASVQRAAGRSFTLRDHVRGLIFAQLSNQRPWKPIADNRQRISALFFDFDPEKLEGANTDDLVTGLRRLRCGNRADRKQLAALPSNIGTLRRIAADHGSLDRFVGGAAPDRIARMLCEPGSYKLLYVGPALALEYLKNVGIRASKPDMHVRRALSAERLGFAAAYPSEWEAYALIERIASSGECNPTYLDNLLWMFCARDYGEICGAAPKCQQCALAADCHYPKCTQP